MRKVVTMDMGSLGGYFNGPGDGLHALDWHRADGACVPPCVPREER